MSEGDCWGREEGVLGVIGVCGRRCGWSGRVHVSASRQTLEALLAPAELTCSWRLMTLQGNPKNIRTWEDLTRAGVEVVLANPKTAGVARCGSRLCVCTRVHT